MTGLKSGAGDDLWGDEEATDDREESPPAEADAEEPAPAEASGDDAAAAGSDETRPYIVRRAIQDKSIQFERDERLTFFVHDDVVEGERELVTDLESAVGRDVPKFDVREAVYRAALRNRDDVLDELLSMGYALDEE